MRWTIGTITLCMALAMPGIASAADNCAGLRVPATAKTRAADAALVTRLGRQKVTAANVGPVPQDGAWRLVWATPAEAERGVFFFRAGKGGTLRFIQVWGGVIPPDERASTIAWVRDHYGRPPERLLQCFVDTVIAE